MEEKGYCFVSQQIRKLVSNGTIIVSQSKLSLSENGRFVDGGLEEKIQPASFEPTLGDELFILDTERQALFRPRASESVYKTLLQLPTGNRMRFDITEGFEIKRGDTALMHLNEKIDFSKTSEVFSSIKSSPKSSIGRVFPITRFLCDYSSSFDEVHNDTDKRDLRDMWLLIQPMLFNLIVHPNLTLNQLRFFNGDARLTHEEIKREYEKSPLLFNKGPKGERKDPLVLSGRILNDGLGLTLDLKGNATNGVVGLRARKNPIPIDLSKKNSYDPEKYFEPIIASNGQVNVKRGEHFLFPSGEILNIPPHLSAELKRHHSGGLEGRSHDAGFADPGFNGDLVFELSPEEATQVVLEDEMPLSTLDLFRTSEIPDKIYGNEIGSHYQEQTGPRHSKHFKAFDFGMAARNYSKLDKSVLVQDGKILMKNRKAEEGFELTDERFQKELFEDIRNGFFKSRYDCENDELVLQPIPYVLFFGPNETIFSYVRSTNIEDYGDKRLFGKHSLGVGGHIKEEDGPNYIETGLKRELSEEVLVRGDSTKPKFVGSLFSRKKPVDRVHFGLVYAIHTNEIVEASEPSLLRGEMIPIFKMHAGYYPDAETETWTKLLIPYLKDIYTLSK